jgi:hypothetical protein
MTKKKIAKLDDQIRHWLMLQGGQQDAPIKVAPGVKLVEASRYPCYLRDVICQGRFGDNLGRSLLALVPEPSAYTRSDDMEFRVLHGDGLWYALFVIARGGIQRLAVLVFERSGVIGEVEKAVMWELLGLAEKLVRELLAEEIRFAKEEEQ